MVLIDISVSVGRDAVGFLTGLLSRAAGFTHETWEFQGSIRMILMVRQYLVFETLWLDIWLNWKSADFNQKSKKYPKFSNLVRNGEKKFDGSWQFCHLFFQLHVVHSYKSYHTKGEPGNSLIKPVASTFQKQPHLPPHLSQNIIDTSTTKR